MARWRAADPDGVTRRFRKLGFTLESDAQIRLDGGVIRIEPAARSELRSTEQLEIAEGPPSDDPVDHPNGVWRLLAVGIAVIDLERAASEFGGPIQTGAPDRLLGAAAALADGLPIVFLEPTTEGRLAASLARFGPSAVALYVGTEGRLPPAPGDAREGPFGRSVLLGGTPAWGPHLVVCDAAREPSSTIGP